MSIWVTSISWLWWALFLWIYLFHSLPSVCGLYIPGSRIADNSVSLRNCQYSFPQVAAQCYTPMTMLKNSCCIPTNYFLVFDHSHLLRCEVASHCAAYLTLNYMKMFVDNMILYFLLGNLHNWHRHIILKFFLPFFRTFCDLAISICYLHSFKLPYSISLDK